MSYRIRFYAYCGMSYDIAEDVDKEEAKGIIRAQIRSAIKRGRPVTKISPGRWEFETPEDASFVSDGEGILAIIRGRVRR